MPSRRCFQQAALWLFPVIPPGTVRFPFPWLSGLPGRLLLIHLRHRQVHLKQVPLYSPFLGVPVGTECSVTQTSPLGSPGGWQRKPVLPFPQMQEKCGKPLLQRWLKGWQRVR